MCNQALAHEETRRKYLEVELSEFKTRFEKSFAECQDAKSQLECLNSQRDKEVATLRHLLGTKESFYKEMEYRAGKLEQENQELLASLKELQEARIQEAANSSSLSKLKNKLKSVEQMHKDCSSNLRTKEAEWNSQREEMMKKLNDYSSQLKIKDATLNVLEMELESCLSSAVQLKLQNEEISIMMVLLKSGMFEAQLKLANAEAELGLYQKEGVENLSILRQQLEMKNTALASAQRDITEERERTAILSKKVDTLAQLEDKHQLMEKEVNTYKTILEESSKCQLRLKEQALQMETDSKEKNQSNVVNSQLEKEQEKVASLLSRVESLDLNEGQRFLMQKELERLEEASRCQIHLEEQALQRETESKEKLSEVCNALEAAKSELSKERERAVSLTKRVESLDHLEEQWLQKQDEVERYKKMLEEACRSQSQLEDQVGHMKKEFGEKLEAAFEALETVKSALAIERERTTSLIKTVEQWALRQKDLDKYKERFEESYRCQLQLEEKISQIERDSERKLTEACNALEKANSELVEKVCKGHEIEFESWIWKSISERLKVDLEESQDLRKQLEASLLAQVGVGESIKKEKDDLIRITKEKDQEILSLQQHMVTLEQELQARELRAVSSSEDSILQVTREHNKVLEDLRRKIDLLEEESLRRELEGAAYAHIGAERSFVREKENILQLVKEKDERIDGLIQEHIKLVHEAWEKIASAEILAKLKIEEKKLMIAELEDDIHYIQEKLFSQEKSLSDSKQLALTIEAELEAKHLEMKNLTHQMEERLRTSEASVDELKTEKADLLEDIMKLSTERDNLVGFIGGLNDSLGEFSSEDAQLMGILGRIVQSFDLSDSKRIRGVFQLLQQPKKPVPSSKKGHHLDSSTNSDL
ncbi:bHLH family protein [Gossypium australe]|uniref:BHLH family protein n=1 Tax=Gossypium australe TaxID=47621 RepID=A0A5B6VYU0_9ROSI|nr:bHLH family protein [Gossypium australe]